MGLVQRLVARGLPHMDRRIDWRVDRRIDQRVLPELPKQQEAIAELSAEFASTSKELLFTMSELRRWMVDDLEAANVTTVLLGETLTRLQGAVDHLTDEVRRLADRMESVELGLSAVPPAAHEG